MLIQGWALFNFSQFSATYFNFSNEDLAHARTLSPYVHSSSNVEESSRIFIYRQSVKLKANRRLAVNYCCCCFYCSNFIRNVLQFVGGGPRGWVWRLIDLRADAYSNKYGI